MQIRNELRTIRRQRGVAAAELARAAKVSRQAIYAMESGSYVPNTTIALALARRLEVAVEDLFRLDAAAEPDPPVAVETLDGAPAAPGQPVRLCRVGRRLLAAPVSPYPMYLPAADGVAARRGGVRPPCCSQYSCAHIAFSAHPRAKDAIGRVE